MSFKRKRSKTSKTVDSDDSDNVSRPRRKIINYMEPSSDEFDSGSSDSQHDHAEERDSSFPVVLKIGHDAAGKIESQGIKEEDEKENEQNEDDAEEGHQENGDKRDHGSYNTRRSKRTESDNEYEDEPAAEEESDTSEKPRRTSRKSIKVDKTASGKKSQDPDEDEYKDEGSESGDNSDEDSGSGGGPANSGSDSEAPRSRSLKKSRRGRLPQQSSDFEVEDEDDELPTLEEELAELRDSASPPPRRKHLRARKEVNYQILPPPLIDEPAEMVAAAPARKRGGGFGPVRRLFPTLGPFGGNDGGISIFANNPNNLKAAGGVDSDSSDDEFKLKPSTAAAGGVIKGKAKNALADTDPLGVDMNIDFSVVGGLDGYISQLKEMIMLPLRYPEIYQRFHVTPPRGVLFHGPPGTGKTLMARALAASCSSEGRKITFFMRKGADVLSKWVGEAERQLRLLFEEAKNQQPSIIFFDEIDGLAPVRSSKQEQIHASIVSTLLALMDGMDNRGQVIVIGATNRPDSVDPALRRPGRFDREFYFPLPDLEARQKIIEIHTQKWDPPLQDKFVKHIARLTKGYGGADLRALCTESALTAIQHRYPQIYSSSVKLVIDPTSIHVTARDFMQAFDKIIPSSARSTSSSAAPLPHHIKPLLQNCLDAITDKLDRFIPRNKKLSALEEALYDFDDKEEDGGFAKQEATKGFETARIFRPRLLIQGEPGMGQQYIASAALHHLEAFHTQTFDLATLFSDPSRTPEAVLVQQLVEVKRHKPSVVYLPNIDTFFDVMSESAKSTLLGILRSFNPNDAILVLGLVETSYDHLNPGVKALFGYSSQNRHEIEPPNKDSRTEFFSQLIEYIKSKPTDFPLIEDRPKRKLEILPEAPPEPAKLETLADIKAKEKQDLKLKNQLKTKLGPLLDFFKNRYKRFRKPIIDDIYLVHLFEPLPANDNIQYAYVKSDDEMILEVATGRKFYNMDLDIIEERLWNGYYCEPKEFLRDLEMIKIDASKTTDRERYIRASEMYTNADVSIEENIDAQFLQDCKAMHQREKARQAAAAAVAAQQVKEAADRAAEQAIIEAEQAEAEAVSTSDTITEVHDNSHKLANEVIHGNIDTDVDMINGSNEPEIQGKTSSLASCVSSNADPIAEIKPDSILHNQTSFELLDHVEASESTSKLEEQPSNIPSNQPPSNPEHPQTNGIKSPTQSTLQSPEPLISSTQPPSPQPALPPYILDNTKLKAFQDRLVESTERMSIESLEQINSSLVDIVWNHRKLWNRNDIIAHVEQRLGEVLTAINQARKESIDSWHD